LGAFDDAGGEYLSDVHVDASGASQGGAIQLAGDVTTVGDQVYTTTPDGTITTGSTYQSASGEVEFDGDLVLSADTLVDAGTDASFLGSVDSDALGPWALQVNSPGTTSFGDGTGDDRVGAGNGLASLTTDGTGAAGEKTVFEIDRTGLGAEDPSVKTAGAQTYNDPVVLVQDAVLAAMHADPGVTMDVVGFAEDVVAADLLGPDSQGLTVFGDSGIQVAGNIEATGVQLEVGPGGAIRFTGDGAQSVSSRGDIVLDTNRAGLAPTDPRNATAGILKTSPQVSSQSRDLSFDTFVDAALTGDFSVQENDRISVPDGEIRIRATHVTVGDVSAMLAIQIGTASEPVESLTVHGRPAGYWELPDGTQGTTPGLDNGPDLVANHVDVFGTAATVVEKNPNSPVPGVIVGTPTGSEVGGIIPGRLGEFTLRAIFPSAEGFRPAATSDFVSEGSGQVPEGAVLDLVARGPGFGPVNVIPYVPTWEEKNPSAQSNKSAMSQRPLREDEVLSWLDCIEQKVGFACEAEILGAERAESDEAQQVRALAANLFGETQEDVDRRVLGEAAAAYRQQTGTDRIDGVSFRRFLEATPDLVEALQILKRYGEMLVGLRGLNVTDQAYEAVKLNKLGEIAPRGLDPGTLGDAVEAGITAWPTQPGLRVAASDRFYLFRGLDSGRVYLLERVRAPQGTAPE
jgi:hypothetical protein